MHTSLISTLTLFILNVSWERAAEDAVICAISSFLFCYIVVSAFNRLQKKIQLAVQTDGSLTEKDRARPCRCCCNFRQ